MKQKTQTSKSLGKLFRRIFLTLGLIMLVPISAAVFMVSRAPSPIIQGWEEYSAQGFNARMADGAPILVEVYASWCPICLLQHRALEAMHAEGYDLPARTIRVDFDKNKDFLERFNFKHTGTLVLFHQGQEIARKSGLVSADEIKAFLSENGL